MAIKFKFIPGSFYRVVESHGWFSEGDILQADKDGNKGTYRVIKAKDRQLTYMRYDNGAYVGLKPMNAKQILEPIDPQIIVAENLLIDDIPLYCIDRKVV